MFFFLFFALIYIFNFVLWNILMKWILYKIHALFYYYIVFDIRLGYCILSKNSQKNFKKSLRSNLSWTKLWRQRNFKISDWLFIEIGKWRLFFKKKHCLASWGSDRSGNSFAKFQLTLPVLELVNTILWM